MSMHKTPLTELERRGLELHRLPIGVPSQLSDVFRHGVAWALAEFRNSCKRCEGNGEIGGWFGGVASIDGGGGYETGTCPDCNGTGLINSPTIQPEVVESPRCNLIPDTKQLQIVGPDIHLYSTIELGVYDALLKLDLKETAQLTFDHGEHDQVEEWMDIARNRGRYPMTLTGRLFVFKRINNATGYTVLISRIL